MKIRRVLHCCAVLAILSAAGFWGAQELVRPRIASAEQALAQSNGQASATGQTADQSSTPASTPAPTPAAQNQLPTGPAIKSESRVVRVDTIVTDKKGNYVRDLNSADFRVFEDNKPQEVTNFAFGKDPNSPPGSNRHYTVLFFDYSTMAVADQAQARAAAVKFVEADTGPDHVMAVFEFGGNLTITQNFTSDPDRLKKAVAGIKTSGLSPDSTMGTPVPEVIGPPGIGNPEADFGNYTLLLALRSVAKNLAAIPGRKTLILFTSGFVLNPETESELTATIDACNKANVAIYPLDARGLVAPAMGPPTGASIEVPQGDAARRFVAYRDGFNALNQVRQLQLASYSAAPEPEADPLQVRGGGGGTGGGTGGGGTGGTGGGGGKGGTGGTGGTGGGGGKGGTGVGTGGGGKGTGGTGGKGGGGVNQPYGNPTNAQPRSIVPNFPPSATDNQQVLYQLASGTGGFPILNTNDLLSGLDKIAHEEDEYYLLGFSPEDSPEGSCHTLRVKVERSGTEVRARSGFCNVQPTDVLAGNPVEKNLEAIANGSAPGGMGGTLEASFFYSAINQAKVNLAMEIPSASITFDKTKGKYHAQVNVLGIAYLPDGTVGARFSDAVNLDFEKNEWTDFLKSPMRYANQFAVAPGKYRLEVALSSGGQSFGKYEAALAIDSFDGKGLAVSGLTLCSTVNRVSDLAGDLDAALIADRTPLIVHGMEFVPSGDYHFKQAEKVALYVQAYDPHLVDANSPTVKVAYRVVDPKTGNVLMSSGALDTTTFIEKGKPLIPMALSVPLASVPSGDYRLDLVVAEVGGTSTPVRSVNFKVE
jgi:VWFA-related protein